MIKMVIFISLGGIHSTQWAMAKSSQGVCNAAQTQSARTKGMEDLFVVCIPLLILSY